MVRTINKTWCATTLPTDELVVAVLDLEEDEVVATLETVVEQLLTRVHAEDQYEPVPGA